MRCTESTAFRLSSLMRPPRKLSGLMVPRTTSASVTVAIVPPLP